MKANIIIGFFLLLTSIGFDYCYGQEKRPDNKPPGALVNYVNNPDDSFNRQNYKLVKGANGNFYEVDLISQTWQGNLWKHRLILYFPKTAKNSWTILVVLRHLYDRSAGMTSLKIISDSTGTPPAMLYDIPNQPLSDGREEDDLQAYTFSQYIKTGDESWPLLFPRGKSVVRSMDCDFNLFRC